MVLISSEAGHIIFWSLTEKKIAKFYASAFKDQSVLTLTTDFNNNVIISGDTKGYIYIWDIRKRENFSEPELLNSWRCHDSTITACQYISNNDYSYHSELICTSSTDFCCRLWTIDGVYIGTFGQEIKWNLKNPKTFHSNIIDNKNDFGHDSKGQGIQVIYEDNKGKYDVCDKPEEQIIQKPAKEDSKIHFPDFKKVYLYSAYILF
jgi:WD40 repeat protein